MKNHIRRKYGSISLGDVNLKSPLGASPFRDLDACIAYLRGKRKLRFIEKTKLSEEIWVRRSVIIAGQNALRVASQVDVRQTAEMQSLIHFQSKLKNTLVFFEELYQRQQLSLDENDRLRNLLIYDETILRLLVERKMIHEKLSRICDAWQTFVAPDACELLEEIEAITTGSRNTDIVSQEFIRSMRDVWHKLTGAYPARSKSGPFIRFATAAMGVLQWPADGLEKRILKQAERENWPRLLPKKGRANGAII